MDELQPLLTRLLAAGAALSAIVYALVRFWIKPWIDKKYAEDGRREIATNIGTYTLSLVGTAIIYALLLQDFGKVTWFTLLEIISVAFLAAAIATYGNEIFSNFSKRNEVNVAGDSVAGDKIEGDSLEVGSIEDSEAVNVGREGSAEDK